MRGHLHDLPHLLSLAHTFPHIQTARAGIREIVAVNEKTGCKVRVQGVGEKDGERDTCDGREMTTVSEIEGRVRDVGEGIVGSRVHLVQFPSVPDVHVFQDPNIEGISKLFDISLAPALSSYHAFPSRPRLHSPQCIALLAFRLLSPCPALPVLPSLMLPFCRHRRLFGLSVTGKRERGRVWTLCLLRETYCRRGRLAHVSPSLQSGSRLLRIPFSLLSPL